MNPISFNPPSTDLEPRAEVVETPLLVIGAGPYGLATAAAARALGIEPMVVGEPMGFWRRNMPAGMLLRSSIDWHVDPHGQHTLTAFLEHNGIAANDVDPIPLEIFIDYAEWFRDAKRIDVQRSRVHDVRRADERFEAILEDGRRVNADAVVATPGVEPFTRLPSWVERALPPERYSHTSQLARLERFAGARVLIVGGRQSAFETAALIAEAGAERVDIVHRHAPPRFTTADWRFVEPLMEASVRWPGWFRSLPPAHREAIERRFWAEGRLKLEPWLAPRLARPEIRRWPQATVTTSNELPRDGVGATLSNGEHLHVDHIILATGYEADLRRVPYLAGVLAQLQLANGVPILDHHFQTTVPGLFITGFAATQDFGPFFGFVRGSTAAATIITAGLAASESPREDAARAPSDAPSKSRQQAPTPSNRRADRARGLAAHS
jgi:cation diffusion facilitator CzcD-associated flavoprotein CzcO